MTNKTFPAEPRACYDTSVVSSAMARALGFYLSRRIAV
jgi:hypothetical protein